MCQRVVLGASGCCAVVRIFDVPRRAVRRPRRFVSGNGPHHRDLMVGIVAISAPTEAHALSAIVAHLRGNCRVQFVTFAGLATVDRDGLAFG